MHSSRYKAKDMPQNIESAMIKTGTLHRKRHPSQRYWMDLSGRNIKNRYHDNAQYPKDCWLSESMERIQEGRALSMPRRAYKFWGRAYICQPIPVIGIRQPELDQADSLFSIQASHSSDKARMSIEATCSDTRHSRAQVSDCTLNVWGSLEHR